MELDTLLKQSGISLTDEQIAQFDLYADLLIEWNQRFNLTAITDKEGIYVKHFLDSLLLKRDFRDGDTLCDIGSGAGFPGIPLKIVYPQLHVYLMEPTGKKCTFLAEVIRQLGLKNIDILNCRREEYKGTLFDYTTARGVSRLNILSELCLPLTSVQGHFLAMKGSQGDRELEEAGNAINKLGGQLCCKEYTELESEGKRVIIDIEKVRETPAIYPRRYAMIKKKPL